jgi:TonB-linked SusC/RagA family outer membrane protein
MKKVLLLNFLFLFALLGQVVAQSRTVTGKVTGAGDGAPLPGVSVVVKGTTSGTATNADGSFSVNVPGDANALVFRYIGYMTKEVAVGSNTTLNVALELDNKQLSEVVITTGYGSSTKESFTGTAKVVTAELLERKNVSNVSQALAGEVAGVRVINTSGQPGTVATVRIRGLGSVNGNRAPLYVVDGVPFEGSINSINPADIEATTVLKDAAATSIYGARGANGVIVITTKSGRNQKSYIEADANFGTNMQLLPRYNTIKSPEQYIGLAWESIYNQGRIVNNADPVKFANDRLFSTAGIRTGYNMWNATAAELIDPETRTVRPGVTRRYDPENWEDHAFQNSARREYNLKFGGSAGKTSYYTSFGYLDDKGYSINSDYERISARLNVRQDINKWVNAGFNLNYARSETNAGGQSSDSGSVFWFVDNIPSIYPLYMRDPEGNLIEEPIYGGSRFDYGDGGTNYARGFGGLTNAIADATYNIRRTNRNELNGAANLDFTLAEGLTFENRLGAQFFNSKYGWLNNKFYGSSASQQGSLGIQVTERFSYNLLNLLRYSKSFGDHSMEVMAAHEATDWSQNLSSASGNRLVFDRVLELGNTVVKNPTQTSYTDAYTLESYFSQVNYDYAKKYFISGTIRRDGSSRFRENKWGTFGSVGAAWMVSNEDFMESQSILSTLKLKASYGLIGDQAGVGFYPGYNLHAINNVNGQPGFAPPSVGNRDLTWEVSKMFQTGVEFGLGNYLSGTIDYYIKNTEDLIFSKRVAPSLGYAIINVNEGVLRNQGLEFDLTGHILKRSDWRMDLSVNGEMFTNKLMAMPIDPETGQQKAIDVQAPFGWSVGRSIFDFYMREFAGVDPQDGRSQWTVHYIDANGNGTFDAGEQIASLTDYLAKNPEQANNILVGTTKNYAQATQKFVGKSAIPKVRGAFNLSAGYKGFDLGVQMLYSLGGYAYDGAYASLMHSGVVGSNNWHQDIMNRWQKEGDITDVPRLSNNQDLNVISQSSRFLTKADYLVLNNVRLTYTLPKSYISKYGIGGLSVWVSGDNLWLGSARDGFNPSTAEAGGSNTYRYSPLSTVTAGLRVRI